MVRTLERETRKQAHLVKKAHLCEQQLRFVLSALKDLFADENFVTLSKPREIAFHSGFHGQRAERTWRARLNILADLGFIGLQEGPSGPASYALIYNPYKVIQEHHARRTSGLRTDKYHALLDRALEIGDESLSPPTPTSQEKPPASAESAVPAFASILPK